MTYHPSSTVVAATRSTDRPPRRPRPLPTDPVRAALRVHGADLQSRLREEIDSAARACEQLPGCAMLLKDLARDRAASEVTVFAGLAAVALDPTLSSVRKGRVIAVLQAWMDTHDPHPAPTFEEAFACESREQAEADVALGQLLIACDTNNLPKLERARAELADHLASLRRLLAAVTRKIDEAHARCAPVATSRVWA